LSRRDLPHDDFERHSSNEHRALDDVLCRDAIDIEEKRLFIVARMATPTAVRQIAPSPPYNEVPPTTTAAIESNATVEP